MTKVSDIVSFLDENFPLNTALSFDNVGLLVGDKNKEVKRIFITLDLNNSSLAKVIGGNYDLVISHHPLIFGGINSVLVDNPTGFIITELIKNDVSYAAFHTNLDYCDEYSNNVLANKIFGEKTSLLSLPKEKVFCGVICDFDESSLSAIMSQVKENLNSSGCISINDINSKVSRAFVQGGSFDEDVIPSLLENNVNLVISGEIKHHICLLLESYGIATIIAGHNATERVYLPALKKLINDKYEDMDIFVDFGNESFV
ncbi:MAG: Nif3-like dinuclear metal center hexameric protein [Clostridia bacterium]|nr:Nif3-like dinuclear metal center hexameric protein [Clostridia bacterium]